MKEVGKGGRGSKSGSRAQSEEVGSQSSASDHSDAEGSSEMVRTVFSAVMLCTLSLLATLHISCLLFEYTYFDDSTLYVVATSMVNPVCSSYN